MFIFLGVYAIILNYVIAKKGGLPHDHAEYVPLKHPSMRIRLKSIWKDKTSSFKIQEVLRRQNKKPLKREVTPKS